MLLDKESLQKLFYTQQKKLSSLTGRGGCRLPIYLYSASQLTKYEKLDCKKNKLKLDTDFLNYCKQISVYPKYAIQIIPGRI